MGEGVKSHEIPDRPPPRPAEEIGMDVESLGAYLDSMAGLADVAFVFSLDSAHGFNHERCLLGLAQAMKTMAERSRELANGCADELRGYKAHPDDCACAWCEETALSRRRAELASEDEE